MNNLKKFFNQISPLNEETWGAILPLFEPKSLEAQQFFVKEHVYARRIAFLEKGCVRAYFTNEEGKEYNKQLFVGPSVIGAYTSLLTGHRNKIPQQALTDCEIWVADYKLLEKQYTNFPDLERLGRKIAEYYFLEKERKELEMALENASERYQTFSQTYPGLDQQIPQYHIASYLGITPTQLSRLRKELGKRA